MILFVNFIKKRAGRSIFFHVFDSQHAFIRLEDFEDFKDWEECTSISTSHQSTSLLLDLLHLLDIMYKLHILWQCAWDHSKTWMTSRLTTSRPSRLHDFHDFTTSRLSRLSRLHDFHNFTTCDRSRNTVQKWVSRSIKSHTVVKSSKSWCGPLHFVIPRNKQNYSLTDLKPEQLLIRLSCSWSSGPNRFINRPGGLVRALVN